MLTPVRIALLCLVNLLIIGAMKLLKSVRYRPVQSSIMTYGHANSGVTEEEVNPILQCLFDSLAAKKYFGKSHLVLYNSENPDEILERLVKIAVEYEEPAFLYRCGEKLQAPPDGYYWLRMNHPSMRVYQLELIADAC